MALQREGRSAEAVYEDFQQLRLAPGFNEMQEVIRGLWIGNSVAAMSLRALHQAGVTHLVAANGSRRAPWHADFRFLQVDLEDDLRADLLPHLGRSSAFIAEGREAGGVLVFCTAGVSRSSSIVSAYLMRERGCDLQAALALIRRSRPWVEPNAAFAEQLRRWRGPSAPLAAKEAPGPPLPSPTSGGSEAEEPRGAPGCELCVLERTTRWYHEGARFVVLECDQCQNPMVVWRSHCMEIGPQDLQDMEAALAACADAELGRGKWFLDRKQRTIHDHLHWHARPLPPWLEAWQRARPPAAKL